MLQLPLSSINALCFNFKGDYQSHASTHSFLQRANCITPIKEVYTFRKVFNNSYLSAFLVYRELSNSYINASIYLVDWSNKSLDNNRIMLYNIKSLKILKF